MAVATVGSLPLSQASGAGIARALRFWGAITFWTQIFVGVIPILVITVAFSSIYGVQAPMRSAGVLGLVTLISFIILLFTTYWCWRYRKLGLGIASGAASITSKALERIIWTGVILSCTGIVLSMTVLLAEMTYLLIRFLEAPQAGVPVIQMSGTSANWISAVDILGMMAVVLALAAEIVVLVGGLWLLSRVIFLHMTPRT